MSTQSIKEKILYGKSLGMDEAIDAFLYQEANHFGFTLQQVIASHMSHGGLNSTWYLS